jgi:hypothetical protein
MPPSGPIRECHALVSKTTFPRHLPAIAPLLASMICGILTVGGDVTNTIGAFLASVAALRAAQPCSVYCMRYLVGVGST